MRLILAMLCIVLMGVTAWHAVRKGTDRSYFAGAPQIQQMVDAGVGDALDGIAADQIAFQTDGRNVTISGSVTGESLRDEILAAAGDVRLLGRLNDRMNVLSVVSPFDFVAELTPEGAVRLDGHVPSQALEDVVLAQARAIASGAEVRSALSVAAGAPEADWERIALAGMTALSTMDQGRFSLSDLDARISGSVPDRTAAEAVRAATGTAPDADWDIDLQGPGASAEPFAFSAMKTPDGGIIISGAAPDEETASALRAAAAEVAEGPVEGTLTLTEGMPGPAWPDRVKTGLNALARSETGLLTISDMAVAITADVDTNDDRDAVLALADDDWTTEITVLNPPPLGDVKILMDPEGRLAATGILPAGLSTGELAAMLPGLDVGGIDTTQEGEPADWTAAAEALNIILPRMKQAETEITGTRLAITGILRRGLSADGAVATVRTVMPREWELDLQLRESAPLSEMVFSLRGQELVLSGVLPLGLSENEALSLAGDQAGGEALASAGEGDAEGWRAAIAVLGETLPLFDTATGEMMDGKLAMNGVLKPGYGPNDVQAWMSDRLGDGWAVTLTADETSASEGDARRNLRTGEAETFRSGYWLPEVNFQVSPENCEAQIDRALEDEKIQFLTGSARIEQEGRSLLNRLAAVAVRCLNSSVMSLEIAGHTDALGNDTANQALSEERAQAVLAALADRGVRADAMQAKGFGETQPIASNNTQDGRAQNRRIEFVWTAQAN